jgi:cobalt-zinc-cadmium efflux system membrane fusion protein
MDIMHRFSTRFFNLRCHPGFCGTSPLLALTSVVAVAAVVSLPWAPAGAAGQDQAVPAKREPDTVTLTDSQLHSIAVARIAARQFLVRRPAVGNIDFNENASVQVFAPYQGRIIRAFVDLGDEVKKNQVLFTIESSDFLAAESSLISAAATLVQTDSALARAKKLYADKAIDQNDYETAVANQQSAEGALRAARDAVAIFGRTAAQIDHIVATREVDRALIVKSPIAGRITARNAAPGLLVQPGNTPAPYSVADESTMWMLADVTETDTVDIKVGEPVTASVLALPGRVFAGKVTAVGASIDPNSRRLTVRSEIKNPGHVLRAGMFATFFIRTGDSVESPGVPLAGVVREGDGTMSVWVVGADPHVFTHRSVRIGLQQDGYDQILEGVAAGDTVAVEGAIFLSNILYGGAT